MNEPIKSIKPDSTYFSIKNRASYHLLNIIVKYDIFTVNKLTDLGVLKKNNYCKKTQFKSI